MEGEIETILPIFENNLNKIISKLKKHIILYAIINILKYNIQQKSIFDIQNNNPVNRWRKKR